MVTGGRGPPVVDGGTEPPFNPAGSPIFPEQAPMTSVNANNKERDSKGIVMATSCNTSTHLLRLHPA